ncbi:anti-sigma factor family protein [Microlunatus soli]|uniref:Putative zinc-finger n=1 Tax=Microlunatus soli TaxID=630515 RepID=A0A1H1UNG8_9ACTN|nr:zf-HC2 domain-containing protein [Microlunatus soli]SDS73389.1 Putative zinc-finger [Microlunatus soli]
MTTAPTTGGPTGPAAGHIDIEELSDAAEGLVAPERRIDIDAHLAWCVDCRETATALTEVRDLLAAEPAVPMPDAVYSRLQAGLEAEQRSRDSERSGPRTLSGPGAPSTPDPYGSGPSYQDGKFRPGKYRAHHPGAEPQELGADDQEGERTSGHATPAVGPVQRPAKPRLADRFNQTLTPRSGLRAKLAGGAAGAALLATAVGFGGYLTSSSIGAAEPSTDRPIMVAEGSLHASAAAAEEQGDLDPHRFTRAWNCARDVTDGRITGITSMVLDQRSGYLVILRDRGETRAVFVSGCDTDSPSAGPHVDLGRG